jgi:3-deoxy-manno-octulosonate cytidylyltransferase (CMP-KDO synthetase)
MSSAAQGPPGRAGELRAVAIVPARLGSTRLRRKMLLRDTGQYLFEATARNAARATRVESVILAVDSPELMRAADEVGLAAVETDPDCPSGTDRVRAALAQLLERGSGPFDVVLNVQGDEPELEPADLDRLVAVFADVGVELATLAGPLEDAGTARAESVVKVVCDARGDALYFSRALIPAESHARPGADPRGVRRRHVGVYAFRPAALERFCALPIGRLEALENLEQLRWLEAGGKIRVVPVSRVPRGIDTAEDYAAYVARMRGLPTTA